MNRIRIGLLLTMLISSMFAAVSLFDNLTNFGIGAAVAAAAFAGWGLCEWLERG